MVKTNTTPTTNETAEQKLARLERENSALKQQLASKVKIAVKIAERGSGTVSVSGMTAQFPISYFPAQWKRLLSNPLRDSILTFIEANRDSLRVGAYAAEYAKAKYEEEKKEKWDSSFGRVKPKVEVYNRYYDEGAALAKKDESLKASRDPISEYDSLDLGVEPEPAA